MVNNYKVGSIITMGNNNQAKILKNIDSKRFVLQCLNCNHERSVSREAIIKKTKCTKCPLTVFRMSDDNTYWIGITSKGQEFWFDGDDEIVNYIKSVTWRQMTSGYFQNKKGEKLHRVVAGVFDKDIFVVRKNENRCDNRRSNLMITQNELDYCRNKNVSKNASGYVGLLKRKNRWVGNIKIQGVSLYSPYNNKEEALIDLLIMQRHYGFRHNEDIYYMLNDISQERVDAIIQNCERQLAKKKEDNILNVNKYTLSSDKLYYTIQDLNNNTFKIDVEDLDKVQNGLWRCSYDNVSKKSYVFGDILINGNRSLTKFHRYVLGITDKAYKHYHVDHLNGDGLDNRKMNLIITDNKGNGRNKPGKGYYMRGGAWRAFITIDGKNISKTFHTEDEAKQWRQKMLDYSLNKRLQFNNKQELDTYIASLGKGL